MPIDALKTKQFNLNNTKKKNNKPDKELDKTLKGVLINNHVKNPSETGISFNEIQDSLLIYNSDGYYTVPEYDNSDKKDESSFNDKKALKPLLIGTGVLLAGCFGLSAILKSSSKTLLTSKSYECLPDLAINNNIKQEPQFAIYRAIRDPNFRNILGTAAVFIMSGITIAATNFVEGAKEIWLKKKSADIEKNLQENLIEVETNSFSGKLKVVNDMLSSNVRYFDEVLNNKKEKKSTPDIFCNFLSFKGMNLIDEKIEREDRTKKGTTTEAVTETKTTDTQKTETPNGTENKSKTTIKTRINTKTEDDNNGNAEKIKNIKYALMTAGIVVSAIILGKLSLSNLKQTAKNTNNLANNIASSTVDLINEKAKQPAEKDLPDIIRYFKSICAKPEYIREIGEKYDLSEDKINSIIEEVAKEKKTIFADAPTALGGIPQKLQYYCYIDENRGHLYNWIINPENKFTKYIFLAFTLSSGIGYLFKQGMDAIKEAAVMKENAKTELDLRKRLVDVEIANFRAKKESAIKPLVDNFTRQANEGTKSKEELKQIADNILMETKNGPPYVYT